MGPCFRELMCAFISNCRNRSTQSRYRPTRLLFRSEGLRVGVVRNGRAELVPVTIGRDYGSSVEVVSGLQPTDAVIVNPSDSLISGTAVQVNAPPAQAAAR